MWPAPGTTTTSHWPASWRSIRWLCETGLVASSAPVSTRTGTPRRTDSAAARSWRSSAGANAASADVRVPSDCCCTSSKSCSDGALGPNRRWHSTRRPVEVAFGDTQSSSGAANQSNHRAGVRARVPRTPRVSPPAASMPSLVERDQARMRRKRVATTPADSRHTHARARQSSSGRADPHTPRAAPHRHLPRCTAARRHGARVPRRGHGAVSAKRPSHRPAHRPQASAGSPASPAHRVALLAPAPPPSWSKRPVSDDRRGLRAKRRIPSHRARATTRALELHQLQRHLVPGATSPSHRMYEVGADRPAVASLLRRSRPNPHSRTTRSRSPRTGHRRSRGQSLARRQR